LFGLLGSEVGRATGAVNPEHVPADTATPPTTAARYVFPVRAEQVEYGPYHHDYPATDIFCPIGSEFLATTSGVVDFVSSVDQWEPATNRPEHRGGIAVAIVGDDGLRYYGSHLSGVADGITPGARVTVGQVLGWTGRSGNARSTPPHLHYGISPPTTPDDWQVRRGVIPPYEYLRAWQRGEMVTPRME
jgi:murein DD-endopeptidase MepM/ murein hydrolase activator NlpD